MMDRCVCFADVDECATGQAVCPRFRKCINTFGSYICKCHDGFDLQYINGKYQCTGEPFWVNTEDVFVCQYVHWQTKTFQTMWISLILIWRFWNTESFAFVYNSKIIYFYTLLTFLPTADVLCQVQVLNNTVPIVLNNISRFSVL